MMRDYDEWYAAIVRECEEHGDMTTSDAQGLLDAHAFELAQSWGKGLSAHETMVVICGEGPY